MKHSVCILLYISFHLHWFTRKVELLQSADADFLPFPYSVLNSKYANAKAGN